jgi:hypothetical protein
MITPSFGLTATERVLPRMALDFTTAILDPRVAFTRSGNTATVVNSSGNVVLINADLPRFDFDPLTLVCKGLLVEESRINLFQYSEDFSNAFWIKGGMLAFGSGSTVDAITSPDGTVNADLLTENTSSGGHTISTNLLFNFISGTSYTQSYFVKANGRTKFQTSYRSNWFGTSAINFDLIAKTATVLGGSTASTSGTITEFKNGWFRFTHTATATATGSSASDTFFSFADATGSTSYTGDGTSGAYVWGAQLEVGAFATSYIPNLLNSTTTRNPDVATMTGTNFSDWYTATTGAAVVWAIPQTATGTRPLIQFDDTTANEIIVLGGNVANPEMSIIDGGAPQAQIDAGTIVANTAYKLSGAWNTDSCAAAQNGAAAVTDNTATIPTPTQLRIGSDGTNYASALIQKILYYPQRIIDAEVQAFSK